MMNEQENYLATTVALKDVFPSVIEELLNPPEGVMFTKLKSMNLLFGGLRPREFTILCGATGVGKTQFLSNLSYDLMLQRIPHFVASVETGYSDYVKRIFSVMAGENLNLGKKIPMEKIHRTFESNAEVIKFGSAFLSLYDNRISVDRLLLEIKANIEINKTQIVILDNMNFFTEVVCATDANVESDRVVHEFIMFCKRNPVHIIMVMHPRKTLDGRVESEFDIKGSSTSVQEAHNVLLLNRISKEAIDSGISLNKTDREIKLAKSRKYGISVGKRYILNCTDGVKYSDGGFYEF